MTRSTNRRTVVALAVAAGLLLAGCSVGQIAETARKNPSVPGVNADRQLTDSEGRVIGSVAVRDVVVAYQDPKGYPQGGNAPLEARVFNDTLRPVTVTVTVGSLDPTAAQVVGAASVGLVGGRPTAATPDAEQAPAPSAADNTRAPSPGGSPAPGATASPPSSPEAATRSPGSPPAAASAASFDIPAGGFVVLSRASGPYLRLTGLRAPLTPGLSVPLRFRFSNGLELAVTAPMAPPLSPVERATPETEDLRGGH